MTSTDAIWLKVGDVVINTIFVKSASEVLVVSENSIHSIDFVKKTSQNVFKKSQLGPNAAGVLMDICQQGSNFWIAGYGFGIIQLNEKFQLQNVLTTKDGISNIGLYKIFSTNDSLIVTTSNNGVTIYNIHQKKIRQYYQADGLHSNTFDETSGLQQGDSLFLGGAKGLTLFCAANYKENNQAPKIYFNSIVWQFARRQVDTTNLLMKSISIPSYVSQTKISFTALNYANPKRIAYWYRISQIDTNWLSLKNQNFLNLIGIPPGTYTLEVKAANEDGVECQPISMQLYFEPKWYQTLLFKLLVALAIAGLLYLLYAFRIRQLKKVFSVRQKISSDLHDDIGSTLSSINMYSQIAQLQPNQPGYADTIQENTQEVLEKLDDIVWATNPKNDQVKNLAERIDSFARPLLQAHGILFIFNASDNIGHQKISTATRQNLFLICKEAINNVAKYAQCQNCIITLYTKGKYICCTITDDGIGFDTTQHTERNGLLNMQLRAKAVKGKLELVSGPGNGTQINMQLPL